MYHREKLCSVITSDTYMYDCQTDTEEELVIEFCYVVTTLYTAAVRPCE